MRLGLVWAFAIGAVFSTLVLGRADAATPGGVVITNAALVTYSDAAANVYSASSNVVSSTFEQISAIVVTPKQTALNPALDGVANGATATRTFTIANNGNIPDAYRLTSLDVAPARLVSLVFLSGGGIPITVGTTVSPTVQPGANVQVEVKFDTAGLAAGTQFPIKLAAETTVPNTSNGLQSDSGQQWAVMAAPPAVAGIAGPNAAITKLVNNVVVLQAKGGQDVTYDIAARNDGGAPATNVIITDDVPVGVTPDAATVLVNGATPPSGQVTFSGQKLTVNAGSIAAGSVMHVSFVATVSSAPTVGSSFVNVAMLSADGLPSQTTTPASIFIGTADVVYDGLVGQTQPINGAVVSLLDENGNLVDLGFGDASQASAIHAASTGSYSAGTLAANVNNPMTTGGSGAYGFALPATVVANGAKRFYITIQAAGYLNRRIALDIAPTIQKRLYTVVETSLDDQPLAVAGAYDLSPTKMTLPDVLGLFGNLPLFKSRLITVTKSAGQTVAQPGDRVNYTLLFANSSTANLGQTSLVDVLPAGLGYVPGSSKLDGSLFEPVITGQTLTWSLSDVLAGTSHQITYAAVIFPSVSPGTSLANIVSVKSLIPGTRAKIGTNSTVTVQIITGPFTQRTIITGRVFADAAHTGRFTRGDTGIGAVRVYLEDGSSVLTDPEGRFSFPGARPGMHVLRVDTRTLPSSVRGYADTRWSRNLPLQRLIHGILDAGTMLDIEFALEPVKP